jgi:hypothetical protein
MPETLGQYVKGQMDGEWIVRDAEGKEFGRFTMQMGTGVRRSYHPNGQRASEVEYVGGRESGRYEWWDPKGAKTTEGQMKYLEENRASVPHGRWRIWARGAQPERLAMELEFRDGVPWEGFLEVRLFAGRTPDMDADEPPLERLVVKEGRFLQKGQEMGDWRGPLECNRTVGELEFKDSRISDGFFFRNTYSKGKPARSNAPPEEDPYGNAWLNEKVESMGQDPD